MVYHYVPGTLWYFYSSSSLLKFHSIALHCAKPIVPYLRNTKCLMVFSLEITGVHQLTIDSLGYVAFCSATFLAKTQQPVFKNLD